jgi:hypothetical protein
MGSASLGVGAGVTRGSERFDYYGVLTFSAPFDRVAAAPARAKEPAAERRPLLGQVVPWPDDDGDARLPEPTAPVRQSPPVRQRPPPLADPALARETVRAAFRAARAATNEARLVSLAERSRWSAALPELRLRAQRSTGQTLRLAPTVNDPYRYTQSDGDDLVLEARLAWRLDRLVFSERELGIERLRLERARAESALAREVLKQLFRWQRAALRAADEELTPEERDAALLDELESQAVLDLYTAGWFSERIRGGFGRQTP